MGIDVAGPAHETRSARRRRRLSTFCRPWRRPIAALTARAVRIEDLADSFPGLLFALVTRYGDGRERQRAMACIKAGLPLKCAADALGLPMWLRRLPPEAFATPLPAMPADAEFALALTNRIPLRAEEVTAWFDRVVYALKVVGRDYAMWVAKAPRVLPLSTSDEDFRWLTAWAWYSTQRVGRAHELLRGPWSPAMSWKKARDELAIWRKRIDLAATLGPGIGDAWFADGHALGFDIVALRTIDQFVTESAAMENCLDQYAARLTYGRVRVFSVRRQGTSIASLELSLRSDDAETPAITQLRGPRNRRVATQVWQAVHAWLGGQPFKALAGQPSDPGSARETLRVLWQPYLEALEAAGIAERLRPPLSGALLAHRLRSASSRRAEGAPSHGAGGAATTSAGGAATTSAGGAATTSAGGELAAPHRHTDSAPTPRRVAARYAAA